MIKLDIQIDDGITSALDRLQRTVMDTTPAMREIGESGRDDDVRFMGRVAANVQNARKG